MSKPRQRSSKKSWRKGKGKDKREAAARQARASFPGDQLALLRAKYDSLLASSNGADRGIFPIESASLRYAVPCSERDRLSCSICLSWLFVPVRVVGCPHTFCGGCLLDHLGRNQAACPQCNNAVEDEESVKFLTHDEHFMVLDMLGEKVVKCRHELLGCGWEGHRNDLVNHLAEHCQLERCANAGSGCEWRWKEDEGKSQHERECEWRSVDCSHECGWSGLPSQLDAHTRVCEVVLAEQQAAREAKQGSYREAMDARHAAEAEAAEAARRRLEETKRSFSAVDETAGGEREATLVVHVSGSEFHVSVVAIERHPGSVLHGLLQAEREGGNVAKLAHRNMWAFEKCLAWMQTGILPDAFTCEQLGLLRAEARVLKLDGLEEDLQTRRGLLGERFPQFANRLDLHGLDLRDYDLSGRVLVGCCMIGTRLEGVSLAGSTLTDCDFREARMEGVTLDDCDVGGCQFDFAQMGGSSLRELKQGESASFEQTELRGCDLSLSPGLDLGTALLSPGAVLENSDLSGVRLPWNAQGVSFAGSDLGANESFAECAVQNANLERAVLPARLPMAFDACNLAGADLTRCDSFDAFSFAGADLRGANFGEGSSFESTDFSGAQVGAVISGSDLRSAVFHGASLGGAQFRDVLVEWGRVLREVAGVEGAGPAGGGVDLAGLDLSGMSLRGVSLAGANLGGVCLAGADLAGADLSGANLSGADLTGSIVTDAYLTGAHLADCILAGVDLRGQNFADADLTNIDFSDANLSDTNLAGADLMGAIVTGADLTGAHLAGSTLAGVDVRGQNFADADLTNVDFSNANLSGTNLCGANLSGANLAGADVTGAIVTDADLTGTQLTGCTLAGVDLRGRNFAGADLTNVDFSDANLSGAVLADTVVSGAIFTGANLAGVTGHVRPDLDTNALDPNNCGRYANMSGSTLTGVSRQWASALGQQAFSSGIHSFRVRCVRGRANHMCVGVAQRGTNLDSNIGNSATSWGLMGNGNKYNTNRASGYGAAWNVGSVITVTLNFPASTISFAIDGEDQGIAFDNLTGTVYPALCVYRNGDSLELLAD